MGMTKDTAAPRYFNSGKGPVLQTVDIGHKDHMALVNPDTAFWFLAKKDSLADVLTDGKLKEEFDKKSSAFVKEMNTLRFGLKPSTVYFNVTDRCNFDCGYCYIPREKRLHGVSMDVKRTAEALTVLKDYFKTTLPKGRKANIVFHGAEPMLCKDAVFAAVQNFSDFYDFGIQTNASLLTDSDLDFLMEHKVAVGVSLDAQEEIIFGKTRKTWEGKSDAFKNVIHAIERMRGYPRSSVICTVTTENYKILPDYVEFLHGLGVEVCMMNQLRCTLEHSRKLKPDELSFADYYMKALDKTHELFRKTGRKIIVANFANIVFSVLAPSGRKLMCDISPCGGGRCFFAVDPLGDIYPCGEFLGLPEFKAGNIFTGGGAAAAMESEPVKKVAGRLVEDIEDCKNCAIRHFCGSPCPAEAWTINGTLKSKGAFCEFYEEQVRYVFRIIADGIENDYLPDNWDRDMTTSFKTELL